MRLAGVEVADSLVLELAVLLRRAHHADAADTLEAAVATRQREISLTGSHRAAILGVLDDPPRGLGSLRAVLVRGGGSSG
jgi:hypothetical protein